MSLLKKIVRALPWWTTMDWRHTKPLFILCAIELPFTIGCLVLFGIADPNTYRTALWTEGWSHGWNSSPIEILYAYANYRPIQPPIPWNQFVTDWNVVISVLSLFFLLLKVVLYIMHSLPPFFSALLHAGLAIVYAYSVSMQLGPDYSDPAAPAQVPWMFTHGCGPPVSPSLQGYCKQAQASMALALLQSLLDATFLTYSIFMAIPTKRQRAEARTAREEAAEDDDKRTFELGQWPVTPASPMFPVTPRTQAFRTLDGTLQSSMPNKNLPLRQHISMN